MQPLGSISSGGVEPRPLAQAEGAHRQPALRAWAAGLPAALFERGSLSARLVTAFLLAILITSIAVGLPAYWITRGELRNQAWDRVQGGLQTTRALLDAEGERLGNLAALASERPTLRALLIDPDRADLSGYLTSFRVGAELDLLILLDPEGVAFASSPTGADLDRYPPGAGSSFVLLEQQQLAMLAARPIVGEAGPAEFGWVLTGVIVDQPFVERLAERTGLELGLLLDGQRRVSSLGAAAVGPAAAGLASDASAGAQLEIEGLPYYADCLPLHDPYGQVLGHWEVALQVQELAQAEQRAQSSLILSTVGVALVASAGAALYAGRVIRPLRRLTTAAREISRGDLDRPVPIPQGPAEVITLARALEEGRVSTQQSIQELARQNAWLDTLITSIAEGIVTVDTHGVITSFSPGAEAITGWARDQALGLPIQQLLPAADGSDVLPLLPAAGAKAQLEVLNRSGRPLALSVTGAELRPPGSGTVLRALVLRDTTEEEAVQRLRSYFLANISHEFRTPLSAMIAALELLLEDLDQLTTAEIGNLISRMHLSVTGLQTLIDNLLESLSIEAGRFNLRRRLADLGEVIQEAVQTMQPLLDRRRQPLDWAIPSQLPKIWIDPTRVTQVIVNLLSNASKYSPIGETITLRGDLCQPGHIRIEVADRGRGIPLADRPNVFRRFMRLNQDQTVQYGAGLGLSVVKSIVEEHGGQVGVEGRPEGGSIFWFSLPLQGQQP